MGNTHNFFGLENIFKITDINNEINEQERFYTNKHHLSKKYLNLSYSEILMAIRTERVKEIKWLISNTDYDPVPDDLCIILFHDGQKKQGHVPFEDKRIWFAIENHGVETTKMEISAPLKEIKNRVGENHDFIKIFYPVAPIIGIVFIIIVTQYVANQKNDKNDRIK